MNSAQSPPTCYSWRFLLNQAQVNYELLGTTNITNMNWCRTKRSVFRCSTRGSSTMQNGSSKTGSHSVLVDYDMIMNYELAGWQYPRIGCIAINWLVLPTSISWPVMWLIVLTLLPSLLGCLYMFVFEHDMYLRLEASSDRFNDLWIKSFSLSKSKMIRISSTLRVVTVQLSWYEQSYIFLYNATFHHFWLGSTGTGWMGLPQWEPDTNQRA